MSVGNLKLAFTLLALTPLVALGGESVDQRWDIDANATVSIENVAGKIEIVGWGRNEAHLTGRLGDSVEELEVSQSAAGLQITVVNREQRNIDSTTLKLQLPAGAILVASAVSADIDVSAMNTEKLTASSVSGDVEVEAVSKRVSIESVSGDVGFSGTSDSISAESVSGDIELSGISGDIDATTVSGDMELQAGMIENAKLETVSGDILVSGELAKNGRLSVESMSGDVTIVLPDSQSGTFKAQSFSGRISTHFGSVERAKHGPGSHLKYAAGDGSAEIRIESFSGNISLRSD